jgi:hypothetical protein
MKKYYSAVVHIRADSETEALEKLRNTSDIEFFDFQEIIN